MTSDIAVVLIVNLGHRSLAAATRCVLRIQRSLLRSPPPLSLVSLQGVAGFISVISDGMAYI